MNAVYHTNRIRNKTHKIILTNTEEIPGKIPFMINPLSKLGIERGFLNLQTAFMKHLELTYLMGKE